MSVLDCEEDCHLAFGLLIELWSQTLVGRPRALDSYMYFRKLRGRISETNMILFTIHTESETGERMQIIDTHIEID